MSKEIELWPLKRFGTAPLRLDWFGYVTRSSGTGTVVPYDEALLSKIARIYWTTDEERDALAKRYSLVHSWSSRALAGTDAPTLMLTLLDHSMNPDFDAEDDSSASGDLEEQHHVAL